METFYTPYGLTITVNHEQNAQSNELLLQITVQNKDNLNIIKNNFIQSYKLKSGRDKLEKKLHTYHITTFTITEIEQKKILQIYIAVPLLHKRIKILNKVIKIILEILLKRFPKRIESSFGIEKLIDLYDDINADLTLSGSFNILEVLKICKTASTYIGFKY